MSKPAQSTLDWSPNKAGQSWETQLEQLHNLYLRTRQAVVFRSPIEVKITRRTARGVRGHLTGKGPPDYTGVVGPLAVLAEAKTSAKTRWPMEKLQVHQAERMTQWEDQDPRNVAMILLWMRQQNTRLILPWEDFRDRWWRWHDHDQGVRGKASLTLEQLDAIGIRFDSTGWIGPLREWVGQRGVRT